MSAGWLLIIGLIVVLAATGAKTMMTHSGVIAIMAAAIQAFEGWDAGSVSYRNNNPGNLKYSHQKGATGIDPAGFAVFPTYEAGWQALCAQLESAFSGTSRVYSPEDTLSEFFSKYTEGDSQSYANYVAGKLGVNPGTQLKDIGHA
jgi:hypothetical protein